MLDATTGELGTPKIKENSVMVSGFIPLAVLVNGNPIYVNVDCNSPFAFRPSRMAMESENKETVQVEVSRIMAAIKLLEGLLHYNEKHGIHAKFKTFFTMVDSGLVNKDQGNWDSRCRVCHMTMKEYRKLQSQGIRVDYVYPGSLDFGGSPTHTKLHVGQLVLDMAARRDFQKYGARGYAELKAKGEQRIHDELFKLLGARVNEPRAGGAGNSNSGNVGKLLVRHATEIAPLVFHNEPLEDDEELIIVPLDVAKEIIEGLGLFLIAIATKFVLDPVKFGALCDRVDALMIQWIPWHPSVPSVHLG